MTLPDSPPPFDTIVFDCDSTLSAMEGIEELCGGEHADELARLTARAMDGLVPLEEVYARRLELVRPDRDALERVGRLYVERAVPRADSLVRALQELGKTVAIVSGGLLPAVRRLAEALAIPARDVHAVDVLFDAEGGYADFDRDSPLARSGGKIEVVARIRSRAPGPCALVGDGATDLEAAPHVDRFVAYGGVAARPSVLGPACVSTTDLELSSLVPFLLSPDEIATLRRSRRHDDLFADGTTSRT